MDRPDLDYCLRHLGDAGITADEDQRLLLSTYVELLLDWNARVNLISRKDVDGVWRNHILHSLSVLTLFELPSRAMLLDLGTGGGLPGIPLAIMLPEASFILCDGTGKKIRAVSDMIAQLGLANAEALHSRAEDLAGGNLYAGNIDIVLARAVSALPSLAGWTWPLLAPSGPQLLYAWKGGDLDEEIRITRADRHVEEIRVVDIDLAGESYFRGEGKKIIRVQFS